jgi:hypothetical protein
MLFVQKDNKISLTHEELRQRILDVEKALSQLPDAKFGDEAGHLDHFFADGLYIRQYTGLKDTVAISKLHKTTHPFFVMTGIVTVLTEKGPVRIVAPHSGITPAGTKRVLYFHEDTIWITVHATEEKDLKKIEEATIAKTYNELPGDVKKALGISDNKILKECEV